MGRKVFVWLLKQMLSHVSGDDLNEDEASAVEGPIGEGTEHGKKENDRVILEHD